MWLRGRGADALRDALVDKLVREGHLRDERVIAGFRAVQREQFVPDVPLDEVYSSSEAIVTKRIDGVGVSSASAPDVIAIMLEQLDLQPGQRVLEIGAGTGYTAALMAHVVGETGRVVTIDIDEDLVGGARAHLAAAGVHNADVVCGDGVLGYAPAAPFDRIILTVAAADIAPCWQQQLTPRGRLVLPLSLGGPQRSIAFERAGDCLCSVSVHSCSFIPLRGSLASASLRLPLGADGSIVVSASAATVGGEPERFRAKLEALLALPGQDLPTGVCATPYELADGLGLWLALANDRLVTLWADSASAHGRAVPRLLGSADRWHATQGVIGDEQLALLTTTGPHQNREGQPTRFGLSVRPYGAGLEQAARLRDQLVDWDVARRPNDRGLRVRAYPATSGVEPLGPGAILERRWSRLVIDWIDQF
jgi:protein-L-isoaspartate(D-aspartate) O-methyltransferase